MLDLSFGEFYNDKNDDFSGIYVLKNETEVLYVGMSRTGIWHRWFNTRSPHILVDFYTDKMAGWSSAGQEVVDNLPDSMNWRIELWRMPDLREYFGSQEAAKGYILDRLDLDHYEHCMIKERRPSLNALS